MAGDELVHLGQLAGHGFGSLVAGVLQRRVELGDVLVDLLAHRDELALALLDHALVVGRDVVDQLVHRGHEARAVAVEDRLHARQLIHAEQPVLGLARPAEKARVAVVLVGVEIALDVVLEALGGLGTTVVETLHRLRFQIGQPLLHSVLRGLEQAVDVGCGVFALLLQRGLGVFLMVGRGAELGLALGVQALAALVLLGPQAGVDLVGRGLHELLHFDRLVLGRLLHAFLFLVGRRQIAAVDHVELGLRHALFGQLLVALFREAAEVGVFLLQRSYRVGAEVERTGGRCALDRRQLLRRVAARRRRRCLLHVGDCPRFVPKSQT